MISIKITLVVILFVCGVWPQEATFKCETDNPFRIFGIGSTYYDRSTRFRCSFENVKSSDDVVSLARVQKTSTVLSTRIVTIIFINSSLSQFPDKMFASYPNVKTLDASRLVLDELSPTAFFDVKFWDSMDLSSNNLKTLGARTFASMQIKNLDLSQNLIKTIDDKAFMNAEIEKINLSFNQIKSLQFLNSFTYFNLVQLTNNLLENFNGIELKKDGWTSRRGIFNEDPEYPKFFLQKNKMKKIDCSSSIRITSLGLEDNPTLTEINLNQCAVDELDVSNCVNLKKVFINDNLIGFTAKNVKLNELDLSQSKSLKSLSLANSSLSQKLTENIMKMENLTFLDLSYNYIGPLNISTFSKLKALEFLLLKSTNISNIQFGTFSHQHSVKQFDISGNKLGYFDMNMIFSMNSLLTLDLSGNELSTLENVESAHFTFTLLTKIDLSNNNWSCNYLMKLIKIFRVYKVALVRSILEEEDYNIHGIGCSGRQSDDDTVDPLDDDGLNSNSTDVLRDKIKELINDSSRNRQFGVSIDARLSKIEAKLDNKNQVVSSGLSSEKSQIIEVKNSFLLESALLIVCIGFIVLMAMKTYVYVRENFLRRPRSMRAESERTLSMTVDDF